ncbi:MAG: NUDIX domain-containing protein [Pseudorhodoplanes sp.]|uniref:NUDIX domain-containing protein n=1 Tax=Pseudorhodoplanes sp. TaxID=1934341 RepID=UPI003D0E338E
MPKRSAGLLMYRRGDRGAVQVLLVHPGGPFWAGRDAGAWSIPKGEYGAHEDALTAARREFAEELGSVPLGECLPLGEVKQKGGKIVTAFALEGDLDVLSIVPGRFEMEWPPRSGRMQRFAEVDRAEWFPVEVARAKILPSQAALIDRLLAFLPRAKP